MFLKAWPPEEGDHIDLQINRRNADRAGIDISSKFLRLAHRVRDD